MLEGIDSPSESRALVALEPELIAPQPHHRTRCDAAFLAHLIATAEHVPQQREKCRAEPHEAAAAYQMAAERFTKRLAV
jgi:hypothetical protein